MTVWRQAKRWRSSVVACVLVATMAALTGCQSGKPAPNTARDAGPAVRNAAQAKQPVEAISNTDPCASRLHDICEPLLLYYLKNNHLPGRLEELRELPGFESLELTCPVSKKPYLYNPIGLVNAESGARIIAYDPAPSHSGLRWAISIIEPEGNGALITKVIGLPESHFTFMGR